MKLTAHSSLRKLKRAIRRGQVPEEIQFKIEQAQIRAVHRRKKYLNRGARERESLSGK